MKNRLASFGVAAVALVGVLCLLLVSMPAAQRGATDVIIGGEVVRPSVKYDTTSPTPRLPNGHP